MRKGQTAGDSAGPKRLGCYHALSIRGNPDRRPRRQSIAGAHLHSNPYVDNTKARARSGNNVENPSPSQTLVLTKNQDPALHNLVTDSWVFQVVNSVSPDQELSDAQRGYSRHFLCQHECSPCLPVQHECSPCFPARHECSHDSPSQYEYSHDSPAQHELCHPQPSRPVSEAMGGLVSIFC
jgi:hypothetical protein